MIYLVSYQHSGNTWFRYCVEYVTKKPTHGHRKFSISERHRNFLDIDVDAEPVIIKRHEIEPGEITIDDTFILLLRDPSKCIKSDQDVYKEFLRYYSLIKYYEAHEGPKTIFWYDEIMHASWIINFLKHNDVPFDIKQDKLDCLLENWKRHQQMCLGVYNNFRNKKGADLSVIPQILLEHGLIKNASYSFQL